MLWEWLDFAHKKNVYATQNNIAVWKAIETNAQ